MTFSSGGCCYFLCFSSKHKKDERTVYEKLGGEEAINAVVKRFYAKIVKDPRVMQFFAHVNMEGLIKMQTKFLCHVTGKEGSTYDGLRMKEAHSKHNLKNEHFDAVLELLGQSLREFSVSEEIVKEVIGVAETLRNDIVSNKPVEVV